MSFGYSVGDFIAAVELADKIRKAFVGAPREFEAISLKNLRTPKSTLKSTILRPNAGIYGISGAVPNVGKQ